MNNPSALSIDQSLRNLFDTMPGCWGCKDNNSVFMYANKEYSRIIGLKENNLDIIGKTDFDMPCETVNCAELFRRQDKEVITGQKPMRILDIHPFDGNSWKAYIFTKTPLYSSHESGKIIGTIFHGEDITSSPVLKLGHFLSKIKSNIGHEMLSSQNSYLLSDQLADIKFSSREIECLFFIVRGKTAKEIANCLGLSIRTVEDHIASLKFKFKAQSKSELIDNAIGCGFLNILPESILRFQQSTVLF